MPCAWQQAGSFTANHFALVVDELCQHLRASTMLVHYTTKETLFQRIAEALNQVGPAYTITFA